MTQKEFEDRTKIHLSMEEFEKVHDIYMACGDEMDKDEFCNLYLGRKWDVLLDNVMEELKVVNRTLNTSIETVKQQKKELEDANWELAEFLIGKAYAYSDPDFQNEAVRLIGERNVILVKMKMGFPLWEDDQKYVNVNLK